MINLPFEVNLLVGIFYVPRGKKGKLLPRKALHSLVLKSREGRKSSLLIVELRKKAEKMAF
ncbi:MAG: hypothetical protein IKV79_01605 [Oscillospiraceae bacterium]|nr:hypothetical protein [Oscillospiraceae bacterium]